MAFAIHLNKKRSIGMISREDLGGTSRMALEEEETMIIVAKALR